MCSKTLCEIITLPSADRCKVNCIMASPFGSRLVKPLPFLRLEFLCYLPLYIYIYIYIYISLLSLLSLSPYVHLHVCPITCTISSSYDNKRKNRTNHNLQHTESSRRLRSCSRSSRWKTRCHMDKHTLSTATCWIEEISTSKLAGSLISITCSVEEGPKFLETNKQ